MALQNFKLTLEYDGTGFSGWQTQSEGLRTIQSHLEEKLERIFKKKIHCQASGRTDSGVHALGQVAHFKADTDIKASTDSQGPEFIFRQGFVRCQGIGSPIGFSCAEGC